MDKNEYQIRLDQLKKCVQIKDYANAMQIADEIDWRKIKSIRTLSVVADVYEANREYKSCKDILLLAYHRASIGKTILYRLVEVSLTLGELEDAEEFYKEYAENAPADNSRYVLQYKILKAKRAPLEEQIRVLEDYKDKEYTERWAYELAVLYSKAGDERKCVDACDDMILWFSEGRYVVKALELKQKYRPLTSSQQDLYDEECLKYARPDETEVMMSLATMGGEAQRAQLGYDDSAEEKDVLQRLDLAGAAITKDAEAEAEARAKLEEGAPDQYPVDSNGFMGGSPNLKEQLAKSIHDVFSGIKKKAPKEETEGEQEELQLNGEETAMDLEPEKLETKVAPDPDAARTQLTVPDAAEAPAEAPAPIEEVAEEDDQIEGQMTFEDFDLAALLNETAGALSEEIAEGEFKMTTDDYTGETTPMPGAEAVEAAATAAEAVAEEAPAEEAPAEEAPAEEAPVEEAPVEEAPAEEAPVEEAPVEEALAEEAPAEEAPAEKKPLYNEELEIPDPEPTQEEKISRTIPLNMVGQNTVPISIEEILRAETPEERRIRILNEANPTRMSDEQRRIFTYFARIPGLDRQILEAISGVYRYAGEHTSRRGNLVIMGAEGSGKTHLCKGLITTMCRDMQLTAAKIAVIDGSDLNEKDPAKVVAKMSGGFLIIEKAGTMKEATVAQLNKALEFRTDCMILILEDEKSKMRALLKKYPQFAEKFENIISIPVFTNDELVTFARTYATENGCKMDDMGVLSLYTLISNNQSEDEPVTIAKVKSMMDHAIAKSGRTKKSGRRNKGGQPKDKWIILHEKDFA